MGSLDESDSSSLDLSAIAAASGTAHRELTAGLYAWYVLGVLFLVYVINFLDRNILSILAQDIKADLGLGDAQLGFLFGTAFAIFYALFGIPLGRLADSWYRGRLIAAGLAVWSTMTALSGLAASYGQLAFARVGVGIGEASASPAAYSLIADYFPARRRALAYALYSSGLYVGAGLCLPLGGWIAHSWSRAYTHGNAPFGLSGWQAAFLAVGLPGLLLALWVLTLREPARGLADGHAAPVRKPGAWRGFVLELGAILPPFTLWSVSRFSGSLRTNLLLLATVAGAAAMLMRLTHDRAQWIGLGIGIYAVGSWMQMLRATDRPTFALLFGQRAVVLALVGFGATAFVSYSLGFWIAPYVIRTFGVRADVAGLMLGVPQAFASAAGCAVGGYLSDAWKRRDPRGRLFVVMLASILPGPLLIAALQAANVRTIYLINPLLAFTALLWVGSAVATIQDCVLPRMRGTAGAIFILSVSILGLALGPYSIGKVAALTGSLRTGMTSLLGMMPVALLLLWVAGRGIEAAERSRSARARAAGEKG
jgi:MFS family permease